MKVICRTNLDLGTSEVWPTELPACPRVGDWIESHTTWKDGFYLSLRVVRVTWRCEKPPIGFGMLPEKVWYPEIELHIREGQSIAEFYDWYAPLVGKSPRSFY